MKLLVFAVSHLLAGPRTSSDGPARILSRNRSNLQGLGRFRCSLTYKQVWDQEKMATFAKNGYKSPAAEPFGTAAVAP